MINYSWWLIRTPPILVFGGAGGAPPGSRFLLMTTGSRIKLTTGGFILLT